MISVGPHQFRPYKIWDRWRKRGRCAACYLPKFVHPIHDWTIARPLRDRQKPVEPGPHHTKKEEGFKIDQLF